MRRIQNYGDGELLETFLVFESQDERETYFAEAERMITESQRKALADLNRAYMTHIARARSKRNLAGKNKAKEVFGSINSKHMEQVKKIHDLHAESRGRLRALRDGSLLEADLVPQ